MDPERSTINIMSIFSLLSGAVIAFNLSIPNLGVEIESGIGTFTISKGLSSNMIDG